MSPSFLNLRREIRILGALASQCPRTVSESVLHHFEDISKLFQPFLSLLALLPPPLYRTLEAFNGGLHLRQRFSRVRAHAAGAAVG